MAVIHGRLRVRRLAVVIGLLVVTAGLIVAENAGWFPPRPGMNRRVLMSSDLRREARAVEQFGQVASSILVVALIWQLDPPRRRYLPAIALTFIVTAGVVQVTKHTVGRARPAAGEGGEFGSETTGVEMDAKAESFPSGHSASAAATAVVLTALYRRGRYIFWTLALSVAALRFVNNAHWLSDVVAGTTVGYVTARAMWFALVERREMTLSGNQDPAAAAAAAV
jgi:membrane-associated phospholipid phosphatase